MCDAIIIIVICMSFTAFYESAINVVFICRAKMANLFILLIKTKQKRWTFTMS